MAQLAINGHPTRGREVIALLEMLGGINTHNLYGDESYAYYTIDSDKEIKGGIYVFGDEQLCHFTLEQFEEKFPYKVGDKAQHNGATSCGSVYVIEQIKWEDNQVKYVICDLYWKNCKCTVISKDLQPYKEETFGESIEKTINECLFGGNEETMEGVYADNEINCYHQDFGDKVRIRLGNNFEIKVEGNKTYIVKKQPQYPKTYEECCGVLGRTLPINDDVEGYKWELITNFQRILVCRDAYWEIAGEQMGLGKSWEPNWKDDSDKYFICYLKDELWMSNIRDCNRSLVFPTKEMRDAFYDNFKDLIEQCKELL